MRKLAGKVALLGVVVGSVCTLQVSGQDPKPQQPAGQQGSPQGTVSDSTAPDREKFAAMSLGSIFFRSRNSLVFDLTVSGSYYGNAANAPSDVSAYSGFQGHDAITTVTPRISLQREYRRATYSLDYAPGGQFYARNGDFNTVTQAGGLDAKFRLSPRWNYSIGDRISVTPYLGQYLHQDLVLGRVSAEIAPNNSLILPRSRSTVNTLFTQLTHQFSRRTGIDFYADYSISRYGLRELRNLDRFGGGIGYSYKLTARTDFRARYQFTYFDFAPLSADALPLGVPPSLAGRSSLARNHVATVGFSRQLTAGVSAFIDVGANSTQGDTLGLAGYALRKGVRPSVNGGLVFLKALNLNPRTFFSINMGQNVTDGNGLGTVSLVQRADASIGYRLSRRATAAVAGGYSRNKYFLEEAGALGRQQPFNSFFVSPSLRAELSERISMFVTYSRQTQHGRTAGPLLPGDVGANTAVVGLSYHVPVFF